MLGFALGSLSCCGYPSRLGSSEFNRLEVVYVILREEKEQGRSRKQVIVVCHLKVFRLSSIVVTATSPSTSAMSSAHTAKGNIGGLRVQGYDLDCAHPSVEASI